MLIACLFFLGMYFSASDELLQNVGRKTSMGGIINQGLEQSPNSTVGYKVTDYGNDSVTDTAGETSESVSLLANSNSSYALDSSYNTQNSLTDQNQDNSSLGEYYCN